MCIPKPEGRQREGKTESTQGRCLGSPIVFCFVLFFTKFPFPTSGLLGLLVEPDSYEHHSGSSFSLRLPDQCRIGCHQGPLNWKKPTLDSYPHLWFSSAFEAKASSELGSLLESWSGHPYPTLTPQYQVIKMNKPEDITSSLYLGIGAPCFKPIFLVVIGSLIW